MNINISRIFEFLTNHWILSTLLIGVLLALAVDPLLRRLRGIRKISTIETTRLINQENAVVIDIREEKEFDKEHILDSINIPLSHFSKRLEKLDQFKDRPLVMVWGIGQGILPVTSQLSRRGHKAIYMLQGGMESWREANMPLFSKAKAKEVIKLNKAETQPSDFKEEDIKHYSETNKKIIPRKRAKGRKRDKRG
ncbi:rhodanese-like protein [Candidatus Nitrosoglobus terrae]|uniref:Rhodanese-like protein n=1 Tax=Candidatus Nitrosoglobus terrae TaxID=1630141 RepID=A0A1Q2SJT3_9GAMM|nr:rhodanese-like domain-containing protein [Candidatus Nitrosoglobus terrae]BAW79387.1 rhodanese-like protein [Candidatus Nitrosoglobus terrae]